jgi:hypothetical protein
VVYRYSSEQDGKEAKLNSAEKSSTLDEEVEEFQEQIVKIEEQKEEVVK